MSGEDKFKQVFGRRSGMSSFHMNFSRFGEMMSRPGSVMMGGMPAIGRPCLSEIIKKIMHCHPGNDKILMVIFQRTKHTSNICSIQ